MNFKEYFINSAKLTKLLLCWIVQAHIHHQLYGLKKNSKKKKKKRTKLTSLC